MWSIDLKALSRKIHPQWPLLSMILVLGLSVRIYHLADTPSVLFADEAALGVNAYHIGLDAHDASRELLPVFSRLDVLFGLEGIVSQPIFQYSMVPVVRLLGLRPFSIRLTAVIFGTLSILGAFFLGRELSGWGFGLILTLLTALSPWHHHFSRIAYEAISMNTFLIWGAYFLVKGARSNLSLNVGFGLLAMATYCYPAAKFFVPLLLLSYMVVFIRLFRGRVKHVCSAWAITLIIGFPNLRSTFSIEGSSRQRSAQEIILVLDREELKHERGMAALNRFIAEGEQPARGGTRTQSTTDSTPRKIRIARWTLDHEGALKAYLCAYNYVLYFSPRYLLKEGDPFPRHSLAGQGQCYWIYGILMLFGIEHLASHWRSRRNVFLLYWLLLYPLPAAIATGSPHAIRSFTALPILDIVAACGLYSLSLMVGRWRPRRIMAGRGRRLAALGLALAVGTLSVEATRYFRTYFRSINAQVDCFENGGLREAVEWIEREKGAYRTVYVHDGVLTSYMYILVYGGPDLRTVDRSLPLKEQLLPFKYQIYKSIPEQALGVEDIMLLPAGEQRRNYRSSNVLKEFHCVGREAPSYVIIRGS